MRPGIGTRRRASGNHPVLTGTVTTDASAGLMVVCR